MFCTQCGSQIADDANFCTRCGKPTRNAVQIVTERAAPEEVFPTKSDPVDRETPVYEAPLKKEYEMSYEGGKKGKTGSHFMGIILVTVMIVIGLIGGMMASRIMMQRSERRLENSIITLKER